jgi:hypothetical protein
MGKLLAARRAEGFVLLCIPHIVGTTREQLPQMLASHVAELPAEPLGEFFRLFEVVDAAANVRFVAVASTLCPERKQSAGERAEPYSYCKVKEMD